MKVRLTHSLDQFVHSYNVFIFIIKARLDKSPHIDIHDKDDVEKCHEEDERRGKDWSKDEDQKFPCGRVLLTICFQPKPNIEHSHRDEDDTKDEDAPYSVALADEVYHVANVGADVKQENSEVWLIENKQRTELAQKRKLTKMID